VEQEKFWAELPDREMSPEVVSRWERIAAAAYGVICEEVGPRGLHSLPSQLNLSAFYVIGGVRRGCVARVEGVFRVCRVSLCVRRGSS